MHKLKPETKVLVMIYEQFLINESLPRYLKNAIKNNQMPQHAAAVGRAMASISGRTAGIVKGKNLKKTAIELGKGAKNIKTPKDLMNHFKKARKLPANTVKAFDKATDVAAKKYFGVK